MTGTGHGAGVGSLASRREAQIGDLKLDLPLDEDDYLMPSPHQSQATTAYMDLIGDTTKAQGLFTSGNNLKKCLIYFLASLSRYVRICAFFF